MEPLFSIITVTRNASETIAATLDSVAAQTCDLFEHIIMDGLSTDDTVEIARKKALPATKIVSEADRGLYDAMNKAMALASGDYLIFLNAGDTFTSPDTLQTIADAVMDNDYPGIVYGQTRIVDSERNYLAERHLTAPKELTLGSFANGMVVCHQAFIVLRKLADSYDTRYRYSADYEWCIRCLQRSRRNLLIDRPIIDYLAEGMTTANRRKSLMERFKIMCHYYGTVPTVMRHLKFIPRFMKRYHLENKIKKTK